MEGSCCSQGRPRARGRRWFEVLRTWIVRTEGSSRQLGPICREPLNCGSIAQSPLWIDPVIAGLRLARRLPGAPRCGKAVRWRHRGLDLRSRHSVILYEELALPPAHLRFPVARLEGWPRVRALHPSFETLASQAPQDEVSPLERLSQYRSA